MTTTLRTYLADLRQTSGELVEVDREVDPVGEISALVKALEPHGKPAVWFHRVRGSALSVAMGVFGTRARLASALGVDRRDLVNWTLDRLASDLPEVNPVASAPIDEVVVRGSEVDLGDLPIGVHSRDDAGRYLTSAVTIARDPVSGSLNTGIYRMMVTGPDTITVNAAPDHDLGRIFAAAAERGLEVPVALVIGHHPAYYVASQLKQPAAVDSHRVAGALAGRPLDIAAGDTVELEVPAEAEIVLEGVVQPGRVVPEGPFGEFSYYYGSADAPVCRVTAVRRREDAIFLDLHPTHDEHRCLWLFPGREARLFDAVRQRVPGLTGVRIPFYGGALSAYLSVRAEGEDDGRRAIEAAFATDHFLKYVIAVDDDIDIFDDAAVLWAVNVRTQATVDGLLLPGARGIRMDPSAARVGAGRERRSDKVGVDATVRFLGSGFPERADRPVSGFADLDLGSYLRPAELTFVRNAAAWRFRMEE